MTKFPRYEEIKDPHWDKETVIKNQLYFLKLSHGLLCFYLLIHSLFIPLITNIVHKNYWFRDVEFWFLLQVPIIFLLYSKNNLLKLNYFLSIILMGSFVRIALEFFSFHNFSWKLFSLFLSETSNLVFIYLAWDKSKKIIHIPSFLFLFCGIILISLFTKFHFIKQLKENSLAKKNPENIKSERSSKTAIHFFYPEIQSELIKTETIKFSKDQNQVKNQFYLSNNFKIILKNDLNSPLRLKISSIEKHLKNFDKKFFSVIIIKAKESYIWRFSKKVKTPFWIIENINSSLWERIIIFSEMNKENPKQYFGKWLMTQKEIRYEGNSR